MSEKKFQTVESQLNWDAPMFRLYQKAKRNGKWDPDDIDFSQDKLDFENMSEDEKITALPLVSSFAAGEEAVTVDILPMVSAIAHQGRLEDTMFLTTFMFDEAKHTEMFSRWQNADRKSTRLNSSHVAISYAVFCLKKTKQLAKR